MTVPLERGSTVDTRVGSFWPFELKLISRHFSCSTCILRARSNRKIDLDLIKALHDRCCSCIELIAVDMRKNSSIVILFNYSIDFPCILGFGYTNGT